MNYAGLPVNSEPGRLDPPIVNGLDQYQWGLLRLGAEVTAGFGSFAPREAASPAGGEEEASGVHPKVRPRSHRYYH